MAPGLIVNNLNCTDLPEALLVGGSAPPSRRLGYRNDRAKFRVKSLVLPTLPEDVIEVNDEASSEQALSSWPCPSCTFMNSGWLLKCEVCETPHSDAPVSIEAFTECAVDEAISNAHCGIETGEDICTKDMWPSLTEATHAFLDCEVSSVGSSWQDIGDAVEFEDDDCDALVVNPSHQPTVPLTWAAHAKAIAASGPAASIPAAGFVAPPMKRAQLKKVGILKDVDALDDINYELDGLEDRRLCVRQFRKLSPQRRRKR